MIGIWPLDFDASFVAFAERAHREIDQLIDQHGVAVACGGSGLYLQAALTQLAIDQASSAPEHDPDMRAELERRYDAGDAQALLEELRVLDPLVGGRLHPNDRPRIVRALEVARRGGSIAPDGASHWDAPMRHVSALFGLAVDRAVIRERITRRTTRMFADGVLAEVAGVAGVRAERADDVFSTTARKLHGLSDCLGVLDGSWAQSHAQELMATRTRRYAKRQDTWARRWPALDPVEATDADITRIAADIVARTRSLARS
jgi:tRNA dimethylallyltransferase